MIVPNLRFLVLSFLFLSVVHPAEAQDYGIYHQQVLHAQKLIAAEKYREALQGYEALFLDYDFIFLQEYQVAAQLALFLNEKEKAILYLKKGMLAGWKMKSIKHNEFLKSLRKDEDWKSIKKEYPELKKQYETRLNQGLRKQVKKMFSRDQRKAFRALFTLSSKAQDKYAEKRFAPHSEQQMAELTEILTTYGYPGEKIIGNDFWMSTILSHHNSISQAYVRHDSLYPNIKSQLQEALIKGQLSPWEFASMDEWFLSTREGHSKAFYGILNPPSKLELKQTNDLRSNVYLPTVETYNKLVEIQEKTGMDFYLQGGPWIKGKIDIRE